MSKHEELMTFATANDDCWESDLESDVDDDDDFSDDELPGERVTDSRRPRRACRSDGWRRVELIREDKLLRLAIADFEDYDFEFSEGPANSAYFH